jgi:uncharacterized protein (TIGR03083 family)
MSDAATEADPWIHALRVEQDQLADRIRAFREAELSGPSACTDWSIAQVLGHLGSGAELMNGTIEAALRGESESGLDNQAVWDRWDAMTPAEQAAGFLESSERVVANLEALDADQRANVRFDLAYLPEPADVATVAGLRLNELMLHSWDVRVMDDPDLTLTPGSVELLVDRAGMLIGFLGHAEAVEGRPVTVAVDVASPDRTLGIELADRVAVVDAPTDPDGSISAPTEAVLRLIAGRLAPEHTPAGVETTGAVSLDDLRRVFPGY